MTGFLTPTRKDRRSDAFFADSLRDRLVDGPLQGFDQPGVAGVADEVSPLVDGVCEVVGESEENLLHTVMLAPLLSASTSDSVRP